VLDVDAFKKAGVELPAPNWSWSDFEKVSLGLQQKLGIWGMGSQTWDNQLWGAVYLSTGQWRYTADGRWSRAPTRWRASTRTPAWS
jgi:hypothetical protein